MKKAFTLAEVLITLGIIGVVAALTLPSVVQNYQKRSLEVATQKFYSVMSQAIKQYMADEGVDDLRQSSLIGYDDDSDEVITAKNDEFFKKYLKAQICEDGCFADNYKTQTGETSYAIGKSADHAIEGRYLLLDGMVVDVYDGLSNALFCNSIPGTVYVDVNGRKGPNKIGYDLWSMDVFYDGTIDESELIPDCRKNIDKCGVYGIYGNTPKDIRDNRFLDCNGRGMDSSTHYGGCFGHFLENGFKFDY